MSPIPDAVASRRRWAVRLARAAVVLMAVVVVASAWLRLAAPRPACADWPGCRMESRPAAGDARAGAMAAPPLLAALRTAHRSAASLLLPIVLALALLARRARIRGLVARSLGMAALALALAALGIVTPGARSIAVMLGNLFGGLALLALAWSTLAGLHARPALPALAARWALAGAALWAVQAALGAVSGAPVDLRSGLPAPLLHLTLALAALVWGGAIGLVALQAGRRTEGGALVAVTLLQALLGLLSAGMAAAPALVLAHNVLGASGLTLLLGLGSAGWRGAAEQSTARPD